MATGKLKSGFNDRGFSFIVGDEDGVEVFLHVKHIAAGENKVNFVRGAVVEFTVEMVNVGGQEKAQARSAQVIAPAEGQVAVGINPTRSGTVKFWHPLGRVSKVR